MSIAEIAARAGDFERTPPHDLAAERCVLGGMLMSKDAIADVMEVIGPDDHYRPAHQLVHGAVLELYGRGEPADPVTVSDLLAKRGELARVGGAPYLHTLLASVPTAANAGYYARIVRERAILRRLVEVGTRIVQLGYAGDGDADELADRAQAEIYGVTQRRAGEDFLSLSEIMPGTLDEIEAIGSRRGAMTGVPTGFADLDALTNGLHPGQMIVIGARPGTGKALAVDSPLPTPGGWTTMGAVAVGDQLIGGDGRPTAVVAATEVMNGRPCYEIEFSDGEVITADGQHQWPTWSGGLAERGPAAEAALARCRPPPSLRTTEQLAVALRLPAVGRGTAYAVPGPAGWRYIVAARRVASVPVRCVQVDCASHLYLAGRSRIPTHNSTLALDFARAAAVKHRLATVIFSLEMSRNELAMRLLSAEARVPLQAMRTGQLREEDWSRLARRIGEVADAPLFIDDSPNMSMMEIRAKCRRLKQRHGLRMVIVDYLQLMTSPRRVENRQQEVSEMSRSLKLLAKELDVPVVAVSQLNRGPEQRNDKRPLLSDLRETGAVEQDSDVVILLHREDAYAPESARAGLADLIVAKHRNGPTATITVSSLLRVACFADAAASPRGGVASQ